MIGNIRVAESVWFFIGLLNNSNQSTYCQLIADCYMKTHLLCIQELDRMRIKWPFNHKWMFFCFVFDFLLLLLSEPYSLEMNGTSFVNQRKKQALYIFDLAFSGIVDCFGFFDFRIIFPVVVNLKTVHIDCHAIFSAIYLHSVNHLLRPVCHWHRMLESIVSLFISSPAYLFLEKIIKIDSLIGFDFSFFIHIVPFELLWWRN